MELVFSSLEFEQEVRKQLNIFDRAITTQDAQEVSELDLSTLSFRDEDNETLFCFENLKVLALCSGSRDAFFWDHFLKMEDLSWECRDSEVDFMVFSKMHNLTSLWVSGGDYSNIKLNNLSALISLQKLDSLYFHEFGRVDLAPLGAMIQLKTLAVLYSYEVKNIATIGTMTQLEYLELTGLLVEDLNFLDMLPDSVELDMCGIEIYGSKNVDVKKWKRFVKRNISEIEVKDPYWKFADLSVLDE